MEFLMVVVCLVVDWMVERKIIKRLVVRICFYTKRTSECFLDKTRVGFVWIYLYSVLMAELSCGRTKLSLWRHTTHTASGVVWLGRSKTSGSLPQGFPNDNHPTIVRGNAPRDVSISWDERNAGFLSPHDTRWIYGLLIKKFIYSHQ